MAKRHADHPLLQIAGLVEHPRVLEPADLAQLPRTAFTGAISCVQRGPVPDRGWSGARLTDLIALAQPLPEARFIRIASGPYATVITLAEAGGAVLSDRVDDQPLPVEQGGPWRLVAPNARFYTSVKWVDRIELLAEPGDNSAERISRARNRVRAPKTTDSRLP